MNSQKVSQLVTAQPQQLQQSLVEQVSKQLRDGLQLGRDDPQPMDEGSGSRSVDCGSSDTSLDGPDWSLALIPDGPLGAPLVPRCPRPCCRALPSAGAASLQGLHAL